MADFSTWVDWALTARGWPIATERLRYRISQAWINMRLSTDEANFILSALKL